LESEDNPTNEVDSSTQTPPQAQKSRYGCTIKPTDKYLEYQQELITHQSTTSESETYPSTYSEQDTTAEYDNPFAFALKATNDPDTLYLHKALKAPDANKFKQAMVLEPLQL
jgi:hypothetical protein